MVTLGGGAGAPRYPNSLGFAPHGFCDDVETARLLRSRPPRRSLAWAEQALGGKVISARALRGGTSSAVHLLRVHTKSGGLETVVLRRYVRPEVNLEEPDIVEHEANALRMVDLADVPAPRLLGTDETGEEAGVPAVLMSRLPGRINWWPRDLDLWLRRLAELLPKIHAAPLPGPGGPPLRLFAPYPPTSYEPPVWARWPKIWERGAEIFHGPPLCPNTVFMHRDFHPGNVLWHRGAVSGVVDWQAACSGPPAADVAHCRANLFGYGLQVADRFSTIWEDLSGQRYHPWAEVVAIIDMLDGFRTDQGAHRTATEDALARAVAEMGAIGR
jgi:aminoglycoside phosphotransferase (APT) family kinase protein